MHLTDLFNLSGTVRFGPLSGHGTGFSIPQSTLINIPPPGESDTGGIVGTIIDLGVAIVRGRVPSLPVLPPAPGGARPSLAQNGPNGRSGPGFTLGGEIPAQNGCLPNPCCRGQHLNKGTSCDGAPPGSKCVSNRRMNALNPRALRRATRRLKGFERAVKSTRKQLRTLAKI